MECKTVIVCNNCKKVYSEWVFNSLESCGIFCGICGSHCRVYKLVENKIIYFNEEHEKWKEENNGISK